ncbi:MAG TPA: histidine kinase dimerization/phospho-acceptor domain-containing protein [Gemmatimonadaceae bacterium]|nr:histidine kinase dimerization/phospho-acceptor domain-containing protein [Gemmatimonadaceae bacterium]
MTEESNDSSTPQDRQQDRQRREDLEQMTALVQHSLNNPLAALLAEAQLLAMETTLDPEHLAAVDRMTELVRRLIALVRGLDSKVNEKMFPR